MNRCRTCNHYNQGKDHWCSSPKMLYGYWDGPIEDQESDAVMIEDDEGWGMKPNPDFGCVHHSDNIDTEPLLRLAFAWRKAYTRTNFCLLGGNAEDNANARAAVWSTGVALAAEIDRLHRLEKA
jgi:hypothetical protein